MRLLIAHKSQAARDALAHAIAGTVDLGLEVVESGDGEETLALLLDDPAPRLAVIDWDLPGIEAPELCRLVRDFHLAGPPYLVVLAGAGHQDVITVLEAGANDCIRTPAPAAEISERVQAGLHFVRVPWERGDRGHSGELGDDGDLGEGRDRGALLEAVRTSEPDDEDWTRPRTADAANCLAAGPRAARLDAMLNSR